MTGTLTPFDPDSVQAAPRGPVGIGDRVRHLLASNDKADPLYPRLLRLRHVHPNGWQRALLVEGMVIAGALVALSDKATAWTPVFMPIAAAALVKFHDVLAGLLPPRPPRRDDTP
ncbi:MAG TPA: hypothetical protein VF519_17425 [Mycobacteriales bacterium]|jgi:hypothetical protein